MLSQCAFSTDVDPMPPAARPWDLGAAVKFGIYGRADNGGGPVDGLWRAFVATHGNAGNRIPDDESRRSTFTPVPERAPNDKRPAGYPGTDLLAWIDPKPFAAYLRDGTAIATVTGLEPVTTVYRYDISPQKGSRTSSALGSTAGASTLPAAAPQDPHCWLRSPLGYFQ